MYKQYYVNYEWLLQYCFHLFFRLAGSWHPEQKYPLGPLNTCTLHGIQNVYLISGYNRKENFNTKVLLADDDMIHENIRPYKIIVGFSVTWPKQIR